MNKKESYIFFAAFITVVSMSFAPAITASMGFITKRSEEKDLCNIINESAITTAIKSKYMTDDELNKFNIHVTVTDKNVTLVGQVADEASKAKAIALAQSTEGVAVVISQLKVSGAAKNSIVSDSTITTVIKTVFLSDPRVRGANLRVETLNGVVTLSGTVPTEEAKNAALAIAKSTENVSDVFSKLEVKPSK